jgi:hypothetical protein
MSNAAAFGSRATYPPASGMWLAGGENREKWFKHRFRQGEVLEGAVRDDAGLPQGTLLVEVLEPLSTDAKGHWIRGRYIVASDGHLRWWFSEGDGKKLAAQCKYHFCDGPATECLELKSKKGIHIKRFRPLGTKEFKAKVPSWAFGRNCSPIMKAYFKEKSYDFQAEPKSEVLPWVDPGEDAEQEASHESEASGSQDLKKKLEEARDAVRAIEKRMQKGKEAKRRKKKGGDAEGTTKKKDRGRRRSPTTSGERRTKKKKKARASGSSKKRRDRSEDSRSPRQAKKARRSSSDEQGTSSSDREELFGGKRHGAEEGRRKGHRDRGPFGGGEIVKFREATESESESFRDAPADRRAATQLQLVRYAKNKPGRLASRTLLKMQQEGARGAVGADPEQVGLTPPAAVHYLLTVMVPKRGNQLNLRSLRDENHLHGARPFGLTSASSGRRSSHPAPKGAGESHHRGPLGLRSISGASETGVCGPAGEGRGSVHESGVPPRDEAEEHGPVEKDPKRRSKGRSRKRRKKGKEKGKGKGGAKEKPKEGTA